MVKLENKLTPNPHTPTPWRIEAVSKFGEFEIIGSAAEQVAAIYASDGMDEVTIYPSEANAAFIVEAANNHAALVSALQDILWACHHVEKWHSHIDATFADDTEWTDSAKDFKEKRATAREALDRLTLRT